MSSADTSEDRPWLKGYARYFDELKEGADHDVLYRIPARESWEPGDHVGFVQYKNWTFAVGWRDGDIVYGRFAVEPDKEYMFPYETEWMITTNSAIDYGLPPRDERNGGVPDDD